MNKKKYLKYKKKYLEIKKLQLGGAAGLEHKTRFRPVAIAVLISKFGGNPYIRFLQYPHQAGEKPKIGESSYLIKPDYTIDIKSSEYRCFETEKSIYAVKLSYGKIYKGEEIIDQILRAEHKKRFASK